MTRIDELKATAAFCRMVTNMYLQDLSDADLLMRPVPSANHIAWQLGHLICSERQMMSALGHEMPELPAGFEKAHDKEAAKSDDPANFPSKDQYIALMEKQRNVTMAAFDATSETDLETPSPKEMREYAPTVADVLRLVGLHELMHAGQLVVVRRKLGKPILV
ncbi:MAG: DinB family protein [Planctomycetes bacterium]|nr:DinB family protein [Planctomycetota bacterium]